MTRHAFLTAVDADLPDYPEDLCDPSLTSDYFTKFWHDRWLSSRLHLKASLAVQGAALNLFFMARKQVPVGSLPDDMEMLARMLRVSDSEFKTMMAMDITPLHNWTRYLYRGEVVLGHEVVIEVARDALNRRETRRASNDDRAVRARCSRLADRMRDLRYPSQTWNDATLVARLDAWIAENRPGKRQMPQIEEWLAQAMRHGEAEGWL